MCEVFKVESVLAFILEYLFHDIFFEQMTHKVSVIMYSTITYSSSW